MVRYYKERRAVKARNECDEGEGEMKTESSWNGRFSFTNDSWKQDDGGKTKSTQHAKKVGSGPRDRGKAS
jgi:hypothetical protein